MAEVKKVREQAQVAPSIRAVSAIGTYNKEARTVSVTAATEYPVMRWYYDEKKRDFVDFNEILSFKPEHFNTERFDKGVVTLLDNHDRYEGSKGVRGVVEGYELTGTTLETTVRFSKRAEAQEIADDVEDGILKGFSLGYRVHEYTPDGTVGENGLPNYRATKWEPLELSVAPVPADPRSTSRSIEDIKGKQTTYVVRTVEEEPKPAPPAPAPKKETPQREVATNKYTMKNSTEGKKLRDTKARLLTSLSEQDNRSEADEKQMNDIAAEITVLDGQIEAMEKREQIIATHSAPAPSNTGEIKERNKAIKSAEFGRAFIDLAAGKKLTGAAAEIHQEGSRSAMEGVQGNQFSYPTAWLRKEGIDQARAGSADDFQATGGGDGSGFIPTEVPAFIEGLMADNPIEMLGATTLNGLTGILQFPRESVKASATEEGEVDANAGSGMELDQWQMAPKRYSSTTTYSKQLMIQSPLAAEAVIANGLRRGMNRKMFRDFFTGGGSAAILGMFGIAGVNEPVTANETDYDLIVAQMIKAVLADEGLNGNCKFGVSPTTWELFDSAVNVTAVSPLVKDNKLKGYDYMATPYIADATSDILGRAIFGDFSNVLFGNWGSLDFLVDPYTSGANAQINIHLNRWVDILAQNPEGFAKCEHVSNS